MEWREPKMDAHHRSIAKAISYRIIAVLITTIVAWCVTTELRFAAAIGLTDGILKFGVYYLHERAWNRVSFGRAKPPEYEI